MSYRYFAFLDLLGYKDLLTLDLTNGKSDLKEKLTRAFGSLGHINEADVTMKAISDSIFLTLNNEALGFDFFARTIQQLQVAFIQNGLLLRGGIAFNQHFENGKVTYSPALVDAYTIENKTAFFPRIVIHPAVIGKLENENGLESAKNEHLIVKHNEIYQIHFLNENNWVEIYELCKTLALESSTSIAADPRIYCKYWYIQEYLRSYKPQAQRFKPYLKSWS